MVWHVWQRTCQARHISAVYVVTDSPEIQAAVESWGGRALMSSPDCTSGTERIASVLSCVEGDLIINVQGDEPLVDPTMLDSLVQQWQTVPCDLVTPVF